MDHAHQIRERIDLISFIGEYVPLKKIGRNYKANCPFHNEKTPSFVVSPERAIWHCFGCGKGGDCYTFLMEIEHIEFPEALRVLAKRTGVTLATTEFETTTSARKEKLYAINAIVAEYYHYILTKHVVGGKALVYLKARGVDLRLLETFKIGFAPGVGNALVRYLQQKKKYTRDEILDAGLGTIRGRDCIDFFRGRIIFPLIDHRDNVVGFSGRVLDDASSQGPKYINTRDTFVYHKRDQVFGINVTKDAIRKEGQVLVLEGEFDVMACFQYGIPNSVAVKGTALTETQVQLLSRFAQKVIMCFDEDSAGQEAIKRSLAVLEKKEITVTVVVIPEGKDPDEALRLNEAAFKKAIKDDVNVYDYLLTKVSQQYDNTTPDGKKKIASELFPFLTKIENAIVREHYYRKLSVVLDTTYESILKEAEKQQDKRESQAEAVKVVEKKSREELLESYLLSLLTQGEKPISAIEIVERHLLEVLSQESAYQKIIHQLIFSVREDKQFSIKAFGDRLTSELQEAFNTSFLTTIPSFADTEHFNKEVEKTAISLKNSYIRFRLQTITTSLKQKKNSRR